MKADLLVEAAHALGEGPVWWDGAWWWVDILGGTLNRCGVGGGSVESRAVGRRPGAAVPTSGGRWLIAHEDGFGFFDWAAGTLETFDRRLADRGGLRMNDGTCDAAGRFWAGSICEGARDGSASLYCVDASLRVTERLTGVTNSNGLAWTGDGTRLYYIDTPTRRIDVFDVDPGSGDLSGRRPLVTIAEGAGWPDGMAIDAVGNLWVALWGGSGVECFDGATGASLDRIDCPVSQTSSCCFGGPEWDRLLITSARAGRDAAALEREPLAGSLFLARPGVHGAPVPAFREEASAGPNGDR